MTLASVSTIAASLLAAAFASAAGARAAEPEPEWAAVAELDTVEVVTHDADGGVRETTIWIVVVDGRGYIRTGSTRWMENVKRDADVVLRIAGEEYALRAELVELEPLRARVNAAFRAKYSFMDSMTGLVRGGNPNIMHVHVAGARP